MNNLIHWIGIKFLLFIIYFIPSVVTAQQVTDIDGNVYDTIHIGTQIWLNSNLKVTHYRNGDPIPNVTDSATWYNLTTGAYCDYENDTNTASVYGHLYNWDAVKDPRGIAPIGWHVPTFEDWDSLQVFLGYDLIAGGKLKEIGTAHWMSPNTGATDEYDFTALPGGQRADSIYSGTFSELTQQGYWWSSSQLDTVYPWAVNISYNSEGFTNWGASTRKSGFSVRLIYDLPLQVYNVSNVQHFTVYPNPVKDFLTLDFSSDPGVSVTIRLFDIRGKLLKVQEQVGADKLILSTSELGAGVYTLQVQEKDFLSTTRIIVVK